MDVSEINNGRILSQRVCSLFFRDVLGRQIAGELIFSFSGPVYDAVLFPPGMNIPILVQYTRLGKAYADQPVPQV